MTIRTEKLKLSKQQQLYFSVANFFHICSIHSMSCCGTLSPQQKDYFFTTAFAWSCLMNIFATTIIPFHKRFYSFSVTTPVKFSASGSHHSPAGQPCFVFYLRNNNYTFQQQIFSITVVSIQCHVVSWYVITTTNRLLFHNSFFAWSSMSDEYFATTIIPSFHMRFYSFSVTVLSAYVQCSLLEMFPLQTYLSGNTKRETFGKTDKRRTDNTGEEEEYDEN